MINQIIVLNEINNFTVSEILHGNIESEIPPILFPNIAPTLKLLQLIRDDINVPIIIHSSFRNSEHNAEVNGKSNSLHLSFNAIDFAPVGSTKASLEVIFNDLLRGKYYFDFIFHGLPFKVNHLHCGVGLYHTFIHIDTRGLLGRLSPAVWRG